MGSPVFSHKSCSVETQYHIQSLQGYIVDNLVIRSLREGRVDIAERLHAGCCQTCRESHGMLFLDSYIEKPFRHLFRQDIHSAARGHGRSHADHSAVISGKFQKDFPEDILIPAFLMFRLDYAFSCVRIEHPGGMPCRLVFFGRRETFSFGGDRMEDQRPFQFFQFAQRKHYLSDVISVDRTEISETESLEKVAA